MENIIQEKSYQLALKIVLFVKNLQEEKKEYILLNQLLRSGTSVGANIEEVIGGISHSDFLAKIFIAYKEARESHYWLRLLHDSGYISDDDFVFYIGDCEEILRILGAIIKTGKNNKNS